MNSVLLLFECITCSSSLSLEKIKLITVVNWFFHVSYFLRSIMISFNYDLLLLRYSSIDSVFISITVTFIFNIIVAPKITSPYNNLLIIIFVTIFFFMLKKVPNISNYSVFDCFIFFFFSLKRFLVFSIVVSSISSFNLKRFLSRLIVVSYIFYFFQALKFSPLYVVKQINYFLKENKSILYFSKKR